VPGLGAAIGALLVLLAATAWAALRPGLLSYAALAAGVVVWLVANKPVEGSVLFTVTANHGLTLADLAPLPCLLAVLLVRRR
jgi:hypothetical protein